MVGDGGDLVDEGRSPPLRVEAASFGLAPSGHWVINAE